MTLARAHTLARVAVWAVAGAVVGGGFGYYRSLAAGACPFGRHLWLGPLLGATVAAGLALVVHRLAAKRS